MAALPTASSVRSVSDPASLAPASLAPAVQRLVRELDPGVAISALRTMREVRAASLARDRFLMTMLTAFAAIGLLLAVVGVYGVLAQLAQRRTREVAIRVALGAQAGEVRWMVLRHGLGLTAVGLAAGTIVAVAATRGMQPLLFHVTPVDPAIFLIVPALLALTGVVASWIPALRASRANPVDALRSE